MKDNVEFVKRLRSNLYANSSAVHLLRRAFGTRPEDNIRNYLAFQTVASGCCGDPESAYFLTACMFYTYERRTDVMVVSSYVEFEDLIGRLYHDRNMSESTKMRISRFLSSDYDDGVFINQFVRMTNRVKKYLKSGEHVDYCKLVDDLCHWNDDGNKVRMQWAAKIVD